MRDQIEALGMWFSVSAYGAEKGRFVAMFDNITERKQFEEALVFKTALLEAQAETTIDGILAVDESDHIILANKQFGLHFGIPDEVLSNGDDQIVLKQVMAKVEDPEAFSARVKYLYSHRDEKSRDEFRLKDGRVFDRYSAPLIDSTGRYRAESGTFATSPTAKLRRNRFNSGVLRCSYGAAESQAFAGSIDSGARQCSSAKGQGRAFVPRSR